MTHQITKLTEYTKPEEVDEPVGAAKQGDDADGEETE